MDITKLAEIATIWRPASIAEEPETTLVKWQVFRVAGNFDGQGETVHFMGYTEGHWHGEGRVCSPVVEFDKTTMRGRTRSGRIYELSGPPGLDQDALYVWNRWLKVAGDPVVTCITEEYYDETMDT